MYISRHVHFVERVFPLQVRNTSDVFTNCVQGVLRDGSPLVDSQHQIPSQTTTQPSTYESTIPSTSQAPSSPQQPDDSPSLPTSVTSSQSPATFQEQTPPIFQEEQTPNTSQQHTHSPTVTSQSPSPRATTSQPPQTQPNLQRPTRDKKRNPKYYNEKYVNTTTKHPLPQTLEPTTVTQAVKDPLWRQAMDNEFNALLHNGTWELVPQIISRANRL